MNETAKPGKYYIGDPSFVLSEEIYHGIFGDVHKYEAGKYDLLNNKNDFVVHKTHYGDGTYRDTKNRKYVVESGLIALVPVDLIEEKDISIAKKKGVVLAFKDYIRFIYNGGLFTIKSAKNIIEINTINEDEYDSESDDHLLDNDKKINFRDDDDNSSFYGSCDESSDEEEDNQSNPKFKKFFK